MASRREIAERIGVHPGTVTKALAGSRHVSRELTERIVEECRKAGYVPNYMAKQLSRGRSDTLAVVRSDIHGLGEVHSRWVGHLHIAVREAGMHFRTLMAEDAEKALVEGSVDGLIILGDHSESADPVSLGLADAYGSGKHAMVLTDCASDTDTYPFNAVSMDSRTGVATAVDRLLSLGHSTLCFFGLIEGKEQCMERYRGFLDPFIRAGMDTGSHPVVRVRGWFPDATRADLYETGLLGAVESGATAIVASSDYAAAGAVKILKRHGLRVPHDVSVIGFDDTVLARSWDPPLDTVAQDTLTASRAAVDMLLRILGGETRIPSVKLATCQVPRGSTGPGIKGV